MKLSPEQIEQLFVFTRQHFVEWYDLQLELVDHLANAIENQWEENPKLSFDEALNVEFKKFGIFGFEDVIEKKRVALNKVYNKFIWQNIKDFFTISTTIVTFSIVLLLFRLLSVHKVFDFIDIGSAIFFCMVFGYQAYIVNKFKKVKKKENAKKWLLEDTVFYCGNYGWVSIIIFQFLIRIDNIDNIYLRFLTVLIIIAVGIFMYIILVKMPIKADEYLKATYPEYKLENP